MRYSANVNLIFAFCFWLGLLPHAAGADTHAVTVKKAELQLKNDGYLVFAEIAYQLSDKALEALQNGIPLFWDVQIRVEKRRDYLWNKTIAEKALRYRVQYHALLNMYRIRNEVSGELTNFSTLSAALAMMSSIHDIRLLDKTELDPEGRYVAGIRVKFDRESLPLPLRPSAYLNPQWNLSSDWYLWSLTK